MARNGRKEAEQQRKEPHIRDERQEALRERAIKNITKRPNYGRSGRSINVLTNYFEVKKVMISYFVCFNYYNRS